MYTPDRHKTRRRGERLRLAGLLAAPPVLLATTYAVFSEIDNAFGPSAAIVLGYMFYWGFWCVLFPLWAVGWRGLRAMFRSAPPPAGAFGWLLLALPVVLALVFVFSQVVFLVTPAVVLTSVVIALVNGTLEEVLWRGTYVQAFPGHVALGFLYPAVGFGLWHLAPLAANLRVDSAETAMAVGGGVIFGLCWGWIAWRSGSIRWTVVSNIVSGIAVMGVLAFNGVT